MSTLIFGNQGLECFSQKIQIGLRIMLLICLSIHLPKIFIIGPSLKGHLYAYDMLVTKSGSGYAYKCYAHEKH